MLSLCMIARDEEALLGACLNSVRDLVDEMIVVDTGSVDQTVRLATELGATVVHHAWTDDFAAARNRALAAAHGDWLLVLDADEVLAPGGADAVRAAMAADRLHVGMLPLHHAATLDASPADVLSGRLRLGEPVLLPRLIKNHPTLCWRGMFHEHVGDWVLAEKRVVGEVPAPLIHFGNVPDLRRAKDKEARNARMLKAYCDKEPDNVRALCNYLKVLVRSGSPEETREIADRVWLLLARGREAGSAPDPFAVTMAGCQRAEFLKAQGELDEALRTVETALAWGVRDACLYLIQGTVLEQAAGAARGEDRAALLAGARAAYETCLGFRGTLSYLDNYPGATGWAAYARLGWANLKAGDAAAAADAFDAALRDLPDAGQVHVAHARTDALVGLYAAWMETDRAAQALAHARDRLRTEKAPDVWIMAADAAEHTGGFAACSSLLQRALSRMKKAPFQTALAQARAAELGDLMRFYQGETSSATPYLAWMGAVLARRAGTAPVETSSAQRARLRRLWCWLCAEKPKETHAAAVWAEVHAPEFNFMLKKE